jgi:putative phosphoribosyl transferase
MILTRHQYRDRIEAGQMLARQLAHYASRVDTIVLALPRGGVPIAVEVAGYLNVPLDAFIVLNLRHANTPEIAIGALATGGVQVLDREAIDRTGIGASQLAMIIERESAELTRQHQLYCGNRPLPPLAGRVVIVVDDGLATGFSMHAAVMALHRQLPAWLVAATPVGAPEACDELAQEVHELVVPLRPEPFQAVGLAYDHFAPVDDEQVRTALRRAGGLARA